MVEKINAENAEIAEVSVWVAIVREPRGDYPKPSAISAFSALIF